MLKKFAIFIALMTIWTPRNTCATTARTIDTANGTTNGYNYTYMYPYMNNKMRTTLNPGVTPSQDSNLINTVVTTKTIPNTTTRRVVARQTSGARSATNTTGTTTKARAGTPVGTSTRRVVARQTSGARSATNTTGATTKARAGTSVGTSTRRVVARPNTARGTTTARVANSTAVTATTQSTTNISSTRCLADYTECMNGYCERADTAYNRCYCSAKLAQIDSQYQTQINNLINQILTLQGTNNWSSAEMNEYWMDVVGKYSGENHWETLDSALNIDWAGTESRVRGQQAFLTGHEYCVQHLQGCIYMATNLRDAYRSEIARDCAQYEANLQKIKNVAESIVNSYSE